MVCCVRQIVLANVMILIEPWASGKTKKGAFGGFWQDLLLVHHIIARCVVLSTFIVLLCLLSKILSLVDEKSNYFNVKNNKTYFVSTWEMIQKNFNYNYGTDNSLRQQVDTLPKIVRLSDIFDELRMLHQREKSAQNRFFISLSFSFSLSSQSIPLLLHHVR